MQARATVSHRIDVVSTFNLLERGEQEEGGEKSKEGYWRERETDGREPCVVGRLVPNDLAKVVRSEGPHSQVRIGHHGVVRPD